VKPFADQEDEVSKPVLFYSPADPLPSQSFGRGINGRGMGGKSFEFDFSAGLICLTSSRGQAKRH
jgi:hypothetical protein